MGQPNLYGCLEAMVTRKDVAGRALCDDGAKPAILLDAGDDRTDITLSCIVGVSLERTDFYILNKR
jgi:hypothetical protein